MGCTSRPDGTANWLPERFIPTRRIAIPRDFGSAFAEGSANLFMVNDLETAPARRRRKKPSGRIGAGWECSLRTAPLGGQNGALGGDLERFGGVEESRGRRDARRWARQREKRSR